MPKEPRFSPEDQRILILAPLRQDAPAVAKVVTQAGMVAAICPDTAALCRETACGAGAMLVAEEAMGHAGEPESLIAALAQQPPWSELPVLLVVTPAGRGVRRSVTPLGDYPNLVLLERPLRSATLMSALNTALRARRRQYQIRDHLLEQARQEEELRRLNETLEERVIARTRELEDAMRRREKAEEALRQAQKVEAIGQLTGGIAHDFNNLLMVVSGGLDMLQRTSDPVRRERLLAGMRQATARGRELTQQLLAFARRITLAPESVDLKSVLDGMQIMLADALRGDISLEVDLAPRLWPLFADRTQLEMALLNLAVNARDAMPSGGRLTIAATNVSLDGSGPGSLIGDFVEIAVRDTGAGIPAEVIDRVFDPFFTTKPVGKGTGLGLSQVYGFATQSGGQAVIRSEAGQGASVLLYLPRAQTVGTEERPPARVEAPLSLSGRDRTILLVEDNEGVAELATQMLEALAFVVIRAANARDALRVIEDGRKIDLVFSDVVMPGGMNGIELARELKKRRPELPILLTTGYSEAARDLDPAGDVRLIRKPYQLDTLEAALREVANRPDLGAAAPAPPAPSAIH